MADRTDTVMTPQTIASLLSQGNDRREAEILLGHVLGCTRSQLLAHPERPVTDDEAARFGSLLARRVIGEPIAHLTGRREFWSLDLAVTPDTLIPRPETELLVDTALRLLPAQQTLRVADLGTGSGAIALAIAHERPRCTVVATDASMAALAVARANAARLGIGNVEFRHGEWCAPLGTERFDVIVSNPPYVREDDPHLAEGDVRFEPRAALAAGPDGLAAIRRIVAEARGPLKEGGWLLLEHGYDQGEAVCKLLREQGYRDIVQHRDLAGHDRAVQARYRDRFRVDHPNPP